jgi:hypothetical protein
MLKLLATAAALHAAPAARSPEPVDRTEIIIDGHIQKPRSTHIAYRFDCGGMKIRVAYRQTELPPEEAASLAETWRVRLSRLSVSDGRVTRSGHRQAQDLFATFAWLERSELNCPPGKVELRLYGMLHDPWVDMLEKDAGPVPRATVRVIHFGQDGTVKIE